MKTAVLTVFYSGMEPFLDAYIQCINSQKDGCFELVIVDDGFTGSRKKVKSALSAPCHFVTSRSSPILNRLTGLSWCLNAGYDIIICSDSDETMHPCRVQKVRDHFRTRPDRDLLFNNSVATSENASFDLYYKSILQLEDILDFNVLGYGAMNVRSSLIPFLLDQANERVGVFDWWLAMQYLFRFKTVEFRSDILNHYGVHEGNFVGPVLEITEPRILHSLRVKASIYGEMLAFCLKNNCEEEASLFLRKQKELEQLEAYFKLHSLTFYTGRVRKYFQLKKKMYWWQETVPLHELAANSC